MPKPSSTRSTLSLSDRIRARAHKLAVRLSVDLWNGNRATARDELRAAPQDIALMAVGILFSESEAEQRASVARFLDSLADY